MLAQPASAVAPLCIGGGAEVAAGGNPHKPLPCMLLAAAARARAASPMLHPALPPRSPRPTCNLLGSDPVRDKGSVQRNVPYLMQAVKQGFQVGAAPRRLRLPCPPAPCTLPKSSCQPASLLHLQSCRIWVPPALRGHGSG